MQNSKEEPSLTSEDAKIARLDKLLAEVQTGWTVSIYRARPSWCKGYLERVELLEDEVIDLDYLAKTWGGEVLRLRICDHTGQWKGGADIHLHSYPPRFHGQLIQRPEYLPMVPAAGKGAPGRDPIDSYQHMMTLLRDARKEDLDMLQKLTKRSPAPAAAPDLGLGSLEQLAGVYERLHGIFGSGGGGNSGGGDDMTGVIKEALRTFRDDRDRRPRIGPPGPPPGSGRPTKRRQLAPVVDDHENDLDENDLIDQLSAMDATDAADVVVQAMGQMDETKREEAMSKFVAMLTEDPDTPDRAENE